MGVSLCLGGFWTAGSIFNISRQISFWFLLLKEESSIDHVDPVGELLESHGSIFVAIFIVLFIFLLFVFFQLTLLERLAKADAFEDCVLSFGM